MSPPLPPRRAGIRLCFPRLPLCRGGCPQHAAYIGRPWRDYARVVLMDCAIGAHIHPAGFHDWGKEHAHGTVLFAEYHSYPQDTDCGCADSCRPFAQRADFVDTLDGAQAAHFPESLCWRGRRLAAVTVFLYIPPNDGKILTINGLFWRDEQTN